jgi:hypothetical protein
MDTLNDGHCVVNICTEVRIAITIYILKLIRCAHPPALTEHRILGFVSGSKLPIILITIFN